MNLKQLNKTHGLINHLEFIEGNHQEIFILINNKKATAKISLYGGQVLSFRPHAESEDMFFVSQNADYSGKKAIRGGIPLCWPWFGEDPEGLQRPSHGFARNSQWTVLETKVTANEETKVTLQLIPTREQKEIFAYDFELIFEIIVGETLTIELLTRNTGDKAFTISQALHSYFRIGDINHVKVLGLEDCEYIDKLNYNSQEKQLEAVTVSKELDRIYMNVQNPLIIEDSILNRRIHVHSERSTTAVVWNPWIQKSAQMSDLEDTDYQNFLCVESCNVESNIINILPNQKHSILTNFSIGAAT